jgi:exosortase/archaeosortase
MPLHPAENRGYRELYLSGRQLVEHWGRLVPAVAGSPAEAPLRDTSAAMRQMLRELEPLTAEHGLHGRFAAQGGGARIGSARGAVFDRFLERNQGVRLAVLDLEHVMILMAYLAKVSQGRGHAELAELCRSWERRLISHANTLRRAAIALGDDPDAAIEPLDRSAVGRITHRLAWAVGTLGEWTDRRAGSRRGP